VSDDDLVFRALADPTRRHLLDVLFEHDGRSVTELESQVAMSRFGVMKHLRVLEDARLVLTRRSGRKKLHHLNPVPIRLIHDRWIDKYTEPWSAVLTGLKARVEAPMEKVYEIYIRTTPARLWEAITDPSTRSKFSFGVESRSDWSVGSPVEMVSPGAGDLRLGEGEILEIEPSKRLVHTMTYLWSDDVRSEGATRVTWEIEQIEDSCSLVVTHDQLRDGANPELYGGWPMILSGLKTWLESGQLLTTPGSLKYG
jgi:DNA-binding transcriptional ArsR family regulator/uncharacterized protein YndB with AHSA1/START domain